MKKGIMLLMLVAILLVGCSKNNAVAIYNAPTNEQVADYVKNYITFQDHIWTKDAAVVLIENSIITLHADQNGKLHDSKITWMSGSQNPVITGNGVPYLSVVLTNELLNAEASRIVLTYVDGASYIREVTEKKGYLFSNSGASKVKSVVIYDYNDTELYRKEI